MEPIRFDIAKCTGEDMRRFVGALASDKRFVRSRYMPVNDKCHFERYNYLYQKDKIVIVYDTKAEILSLTSKPDTVDLMKALYARAAESEAATGVKIPTEANSPAMAPPKAEKSAASKHERTADKAAAQNESAPKQKKSALGEGKSAKLTKEKEPALVKAAAADKTKRAPSIRKETAADKNRPDSGAGAGKQNQSDAGKQSESKVNPVKASPQSKTVSSQSKTALPPSKTATKPDKAKTAPTESAASKARTALPDTGVIQPAAESVPEYKNGYSIRKYPQERLEAVLKRFKTLDGVSCKAEPMTAKGTVQETLTYNIEDTKHQKLKLRYMPKKQSLQLQGKRSSLFGEIQVLISKDSDYLSAVNSHIELTGEEKRAGDIQRQLKKSVPDAFGYLSEQSKIDLAIGLIDIGNEDVRLSDYSVLLVPPYRGLERLIYDLQRAQGIEVKMIGQAYEKDDGVYVLKSGYRKKIKSVVYAEVMSALYIEYFEKRNFYAHSDNSEGSVARVITDKAQAKTIFDNLLKLINYNCKKLREIGFSVS